MIQDIKNREDVKVLVDAFYEKIKIDKTIGYFFTEIVKVNWDKHIAIMYEFWENVLFHSGTYDGNPMQQHQNVNEKRKISSKHFDHWIILFNSTVDEFFIGPKAEFIKQRALSISKIMQLKIV